jgi:hypothetical protein
VSDNSLRDVVVRGLERGVFAREVGTLLAAARWSAADLEQVLATTARIDLADAGSWSREWTAAGGEAWAAARAGDRPSAYLHAASYYGAALALIDESDGLVDENALWERQRECWDHAVARLGGEPVTIPYEQTTLPGFFFPAGGGRRPLIVVDPGGRIVTSEALIHVGAAARARDYNWLTFDGPGRQAAHRRQGLVLRPDWEAVIAPVVDVVSRRPDVDRRRIAIVGLEFGAFGVARALTVERRFATALLLPGIHDAASAWLAGLPEGARAALLDEDRERFEAELHVASLFAPELPDLLRRSGRCFGGAGASVFDLFRRISTHRLEERVVPIEPPTLVCEAPDASCWPGQAAEVARRLGSAATLVRGRRGQDVLADWLDAAF